MIAADTSTWIAHFQDSRGSDVAALRRALEDHALVMVPAVICELLSFPPLPDAHKAAMLRLPQLPLTDGYWQRAGDLRRIVLSRGRKARLGDALIAQACVDHAVPLLTRDRDFVAFAETAGLQALLPSAPVGY